MSHEHIIVLQLFTTVVLCFVFYKLGWNSRNKTVQSMHIKNVECMRRVIDCSVTLKLIHNVTSLTPELYTRQPKIKIYIELLKNQLDDIESKLTQ